MQRQGEGSGRLFRSCLPSFAMGWKTCTLQAGGRLSVSKSSLFKTTSLVHADGHNHALDPTGLCPKCFKTFFWTVKNGTAYRAAPPPAGPRRPNGHRTSRNSSWHSCTLESSQGHDVTLANHRGRAGLDVGASSDMSVVVWCVPSTSTNNATPSLYQWAGPWRLGGGWGEEGGAIECGQSGMAQVLT